MARVAATGDPRSAVESRCLIESREVSPLELVQSALAAVEAAAELNAVITRDDETALRIAREMTRAWPDERPPLFGLACTVKDTIEVAGMRATAGSRLLESYVPARTASVVATIQRAGAIVIGKSNCPEFGIGNLDTTNLLFGRTANPWDLDRSPGGSSGGDSAAVAASLCAFSVGTDYGGSVRTPANFTGVTALRPTPGRLAQDGVLPLTPSALDVGSSPSRLQRALQTIGFQARSVGDLQLLAEVVGLNGPDDQQPLPRACAWFGGDGTVDVRADVVAAVAACAKVLRAAGLRVAQVRPPLFDRAHPLLALMRAAEGVPEIAHLSAGHRDLLTPLVRAEVERPPEPAADWVIEEARRIRAAMAAFLDQWPLLLMPVDAEPAFIHDEPWRPRADIEACCRAVTLLGLPSVVIAATMSVEGLPVGVQLAGRPHHEREVLAAAALIEAAMGRWPPAPRGVTAA